MTDTLRERLEGASEGLLYSSESDRPFHFVRFAGVRIPVGELTPELVATVAGMPGAAAREWQARRLLAQKIGGVDPIDTVGLALVPRYVALERTLDEVLGTWRVFRVGRVEVRVLALGNDPGTGELAGLETVAIET